MGGSFDLGIKLKKLRIKAVSKRFVMKLIVIWLLLGKREHNLNCVGMHLLLDVRKCIISFASFVTDLPYLKCLGP